MLIGSPPFRKVARGEGMTASRGGKGTGLAAGPDTRSTGIKKAGAQIWPTAQRFVLAVLPPRNYSVGTDLPHTAGLPFARTVPAVALRRMQFTELPH